jgi:acyl carrier protein
MVPSAFVELDRLPLTPSGKVDRRALLLPQRARPDLGRGSVPAETPLERTIVDIWADVLGVERVGPNDNFFDLGGHSLLATQAVVRLRSRLGVDLGVRDLFETPTPSGLAHRIQQRSAISQADEPRLARGIAKEPFRASYGQERIWWLDQLQPGTALYNVSDSQPISGRFDQAALALSLRELSRRHESLRTTFQLAAGRPVPVIGATTAVPFATVDMSQDRDPQAAASAHAAEEAQRPFDLARGPLWRAVVLRLGPERHTVLLTMHHIVTDGWSMNLLRRELQSLYAAFTTGQPSRLDDPAVRYVDYAAWQRQRQEGPRLARELSYWKHRLTGAPHAVRLRGDHRSPSTPSHRGATQGRLVSAELAQRLHQVGKPYGASLFMTLLAAFNALLYANSGERDLVVGIAVANRSRPELEGVVGLFANLLDLRVEVDGAARFEQLLGRVREVTLGAYEHQELPYEKLVEALRPERARSFNPLFNVAFSHNASEPTAQIDRVPVNAPADDDAVVVPGPSRYDLVLATADAPAGFRLSFDYSRDLFEDATVSHMLDELICLLEGVVDDPRRTIDHLGLRVGEVAAR